MISTGIHEAITRRCTGTWTYEWNVEGQLVRVIKDAQEVARFSYDALGRRVEKVAGGATWTYLYDGDDILQETISSGPGTGTFRYVHGPGIDEPLAREKVSDGTREYFHADGLGSIVAMTDASGNVTSRRQYDAWGNLESSAAEAGYAFTGREWDPETGLYYYRARYYDPKLGRFLNEDPIGFDGGINFYSYVYDNPTNLTDPSGNAAQIAAAAALAWAAAELGFEAYDIYDTIKTLIDPNADAVEKGLSGGGLAMGTVCPGGLYGPLLKRLYKGKTFRIIRDHLTKGDLEAARRELAGEVVKLKASGKAFDHIDEVRSAQRGLLNRIEALNSQLANPNLSSAQRALIQAELGVASRVLDYSERYLRR